MKFIERKVDVEEMIDVNVYDIHFGRCVFSVAFIDFSKNTNVSGIECLLSEYMTDNVDDYDFINTYIFFYGEATEDEIKEINKSMFFSRNYYIEDFTFSEYGVSDVLEEHIFMARETVEAKVKFVQDNLSPVIQIAVSDSEEYNEGASDTLKKLRAIDKLRSLLFVNKVCFKIDNLDSGLLELIKQKTNK